MSPKIFSGKNSGTVDNPILTGIAVGEECITDADGNKRTGIFALVDNKPVFELDPINKKYKFEGEINATSGSLECLNVNRCKIEDALIQGATKINTASNGSFHIKSNFITFNAPNAARQILKVPTTDMHGGLDPTLNAPIEFKIMNISPYVISVLFGGNSQNDSICKAYNKTTITTAVSQSATSLTFNVLSIPIGWLANLIFIPTSKAAGEYMGGWYLLNSNDYQLYYHPIESENLKNEMVPIAPNAIITK